MVGSRLICLVINERRSVLFATLAEREDVQGNKRRQILFLTMVTNRLPESQSSLDIQGAFLKLSLSC